MPEDLRRTWRLSKSFSIAIYFERKAVRNATDPNNENGKLKLHTANITEP